MGRYWPPPLEYWDGKIANEQFLSDLLDLCLEPSAPPLDKDKE